MCFSFDCSFNSDDIQLNGGGGGRPQLTDKMVRPSCYDTTLLVYKFYNLKHFHGGNGISKNGAKYSPPLLRPLLNGGGTGRRTKKRRPNSLVEYSVVRHQVRLKNFVNFFQCFGGGLI